MANSYAKDGIALPEGVIDNGNPNQLSGNNQKVSDYITDKQFVDRTFNAYGIGVQAAIGVSNEPDVLQMGQILDSVKAAYSIVPDMRVRLKERINVFNSLARQLAPYCSTPPTLIEDDI